MTEHAHVHHTLMPQVVTLNWKHWMLLACLIGLPSGGVMGTNWRQAERVDAAIVQMDKRLTVSEKTQEFMSGNLTTLQQAVNAMSANAAVMARYDEKIEDARRRLDRLEQAHSSK